LQAAQAQLQVNLKPDPTKTQIKWKWNKGDVLAQGDLGDPINLTDYALCVYDSTTSTSSLITSLYVQANAAWVDKDPKGFKYNDPTLAQAGVQLIDIRPGDATKAKVQLKAKGGNVPAPAPFSPTELFDEDPSVTVQLVNSDGTCWTTEFDAADTKKNTNEQFKAVAK